MARFDADAQDFLQNSQKYLAAGGLRLVGFAVDDSRRERQSVPSPTDEPECRRAATGALLQASSPTVLVCDHGDRLLRRGRIFGLCRQDRERRRAVNNCENCRLAGSVQGCPNLRRCWRVSEKLIVARDFSCAWFQPSTANQEIEHRAKTFKNRERMVEHIYTERDFATT